MIEILVALTIGALIIVAAHGLLAHMSDAVSFVAMKDHAENDRINAVRELRELGGRLEVGPGDSLEFVGLPQRARFASWCDVPAGWLERCVVTLGFVEASGKCELWESELWQRPVLLMTGTGAGSFLYLNSASNGGQWFSRWDVEITAPLALGVVIGADTTIVRFGARG